MILRDFAWASKKNTKWWRSKSWWKSHLNDLATQNLRSRGSSNFTPDEDTGRISSADGSFTGGGEAEDIFPIGNCLFLYDAFT